MSYRMARTLSRIAKLGEKAVARSNCAQNRNILFKCPRWSYYRSHILHPLLIFDGQTGDLLSAVLRSGNQGAAAHIVPILGRLVAAI